MMLLLMLMTIRIAIKCLLMLGSIPKIVSMLTYITLSSVMESITQTSMELIILEPEIIVKTLEMLVILKIILKPILKYKRFTTTVQVLCLLIDWMSKKPLYHQN